MKVFCCAFFVFFVFQAVECLLQQTSASDAEREVTGVQVAGGSATVLDSGITETQPDLVQAVHLESNPADQTSDSQLFEHDDAVGCFEDIIKVENLFLPSFEVESGSLVPGSVPPGVKGRLKAHVPFWEKIGAPPFIIDCIRQGYKIPFYVSPPPAEFSNNRSALEHSEFVHSAILELLSSGRVCQVPKSCLYVINPLSVSVQSCGKRRLILDLRYINHHVFKQKFKFEDWRVGLDYFEKGSYFTKFDLKSGYHHLDIFPEHQPFLGFSWVMSDGEPSFFMFTVLPFGLSSAPYIFTKLLRPLVRHWRSQGIRAVVYLDDGFDVEPTESLSLIHSNILRSDLAAAGFISNDDKSVWVPVQFIVWLGIVWDGIQGNISITESRIDKALSHIDSALQPRALSARSLASIVGKIISMSPVLGNLARIMTRHCQMSVAAAQNWDSVFLLDRYCVVELEFWKNNLRSVNTRSVSDSVTPFVSIYSDASDVACAGHIDGKDICAHRMFTEAERQESSTYRELLAVQFVLSSFSSFLPNSRVKWFTDNQGAARIAQVGSMHFNLHKLAFNIFSLCFKLGIVLDIQWVPRSLNDKADYLSKIIDYDDWELAPEFFQQLDGLWGPHIVDCFASYYNRKVPKYFSRFWNPATSGVDAFFQDWRGENCLLVPPIPILSKVLIFMFKSGASGTLIAPHWPSAPFWPLLVNKFWSFVADYAFFEGALALRLGHNTNSLLGSSSWNGFIIAVKLNFSDGVITSQLDRP